MQSLINFDEVNTKIITIRNQNVILDSDVATLYGVETKRVNEAVKNNLEKFPKGYIIELKNNEFHTLRSKFSTAPLESVKKSSNYIKSNSLPKAFTEKGLYMLATILKSPRATQATIAIVEAFTKLRQLANNIAILSSIDAETMEPEIIESTVEKTGGLFNDLLFSTLPVSSSKTLAELNLGVIKISREITSEQNNSTLQNQIAELKQILLEMKKNTT